MLSHLTDDYVRYGQLYNVSTFQFESYLGRLKSMLKSGFLPLKQIIARLDERKITKIKLIIQKKSIIKRGYVYLLNTHQSCVVIDTGDDIVNCKLYNLQS